MKLYREYKQKQEMLAKEQKDREKLELGKETVIIYESTDFVSGMIGVFKNLLFILLFVVILLIITAVVAGIIIWISKGV